jgi:tRNA threonylcarbamoyladenosine biosynthesis protein TsaE
MTTTIIEARQRFLPDAPATMEAGARVATALHGGMVITLSGELGTGKTTFVRGVLRALGWKGPVKSPSYGLVEHYVVSSLYFYHFDFYRFDDPDEWRYTGFAEHFRPDSICAIEWPEHVARWLPEIDLAVRLEHAGQGRRLTLEALSPAGRQCLATLDAAPP